VNYGLASKYYDLFGSKNDVAFYKELALKHGKKALELGVGTARVAIELVRVGVTVWGIGNSKYMLNVAKEKLEREKASVRKRLILKLADMRSFRLKEKFPLIYIPSATFEHCISEKDQKKCLNCIHNTLKSKGILAFDLSKLEPEKPESSWWIDRKETGDSGKVVRTIFSRRNPKTNIVSLNFFFDVYQKGKLKERYYEYGEARLFSKEKIEKLLKEACFKIDKIYGDFDKSAYTLKSQRIIFVASRK